MSLSPVRPPLPLPASCGEMFQHNGSRCGHFQPGLETCRDCCDNPPSGFLPDCLAYKKLRKIAANGQMSIAAITISLHETIGGIRIVKAFGMENYEKARFKTINDKNLSFAQKSWRFRLLFSPLRNSWAVWSSFSQFSRRMVRYPWKDHSRKLLLLHSRLAHAL